ncbi:hypothetical protein [Sphingomonas prati]|uniref:Uncharacterized protein n=1 Tax=Sphingomonas prati TaxID=1843237 RepID=A0A7W9F270_9SPHN|nr:hypothetical protein [Sphingomonas prati]MBB5730021.1 hypothetical protein [Sphingomonas prati]GGE90823.1 hypothetical protein GCM10011404_24700 [Sphingomonas prati]
MAKQALPTWLYVVVATIIAVTAFGIAQVADGAGMIFVVLATTSWTAFSVSHQRRWLKTHG